MRKDGAHLYPAMPFTSYAYLTDADALATEPGVRVRFTRSATDIERAAGRHGVLIATVAHAGDGNLHPVFVFDHQPEVPASVWAAADEVFRAALDLGGTLTGEHGVGVIKRRWLALELGEDAMAVHRAIKAALDPAGIMNPGKAI